MVDKYSNHLVVQPIPEVLVSSHQEYDLKDSNGQCPLCPMCFKYIGVLEKHLATAHNIDTMSIYISCDCGNKCNYKNYNCHVKLCKADAG